MLVTDSLLAYTLAATLLTLTPGLDTALILRTATAEGGRKALHAALGIDLGCFIWGALVAFGLGALLAVSELAYTLLKWCGAGYLCWLGIQLLLRPRQQFNTHPAESDSTSNWFLRGMLGNVLNPKMGVFYVSFFAPVYPCRAFTDQLDLSPGHHPCIDRDAVVVNADYRHSLCRRHPEKTSRSEMDGSDDRLPVSIIRCEAGNESPVISGFVLPGGNARFHPVSPCRNTDFPAMPWQISCTLTLIDYTLMAACAASSSCRDGGYQNQYPEHWVNGAEEHVFM